MATLKDIANHARVSVCTVSKYLNANMSVKKETEDRINNAIKELGYVPNIVAKSLKQNYTNNIAVIVPKINNLYYSEMTSGISEVLGNQRYNIFIYEVENLNLSEIEIINLMKENMVAGIIFIGNFSDKGFMEYLKKHRDFDIPVVYVNRVIQKSSIPILYPNLEEAFNLALHSLKHKKKVIFLNKSLPEELIAIYENVYKSIFKKESIPSIFNIRDDESLNTDFVLEIRKVKADAIIVSNEMTAVHLNKLLAQEGIKVPDEIAIIGLGNSLISKLTVPELSCIDLRNRELGMRSAEMILSQIKKETFETIQVISPFMVNRKST